MNSTLSPLSTAQLTQRLADLQARERCCVVDFLHTLVEMERRKAHAELGYDSLFTFCVDALHLSEGYTFRRITAARLLARFPAIEPFLADGRVTLSNIVLLRDVLSDSNLIDVLERATHRRKSQVEELFAELSPRPDVADSLRKLPQLAAASNPPPPVAASAAPAPLVASSRAQTTAVAPVPATPAAPPTERHETVAPLSPGRYLLKVTVGAEVKEKFERVQAALSHVIPDGNFEEVLDEALSMALAVLAKQHRVAVEDAHVKGVTFAAKVTASAAEKSDDEDASDEAANVPADVKRSVRARDGDCCTFVGADGRRCGSRHQLQFHHRTPRALGGKATLDNITLHCRAHNHFQAILDFGAEHMGQFERRR